MFTEIRLNLVKHVLRLLGSIVVVTSNMLCVFLRAYTHIYERIVELGALVERRFFPKLLHSKLVTLSYISNRTMLRTRMQTTPKRSPATFNYKSFRASSMYIRNVITRAKFDLHPNFISNELFSSCGTCVHLEDRPWFCRIDCFCLSDGAISYLRIEERVVVESNVKCSLPSKQNSVCTPTCMRSREGW
jgi:hypothetical protein